MSEFIHANVSKKHAFPTKETFAVPECLSDHDEYPLAIGDGKNRTGFWLSPVIIDSEGKETTPWIEYSRQEHQVWETTVKVNFTEEDLEYDSDSDFAKTMRTKDSGYNWHTAPTMNYSLADDAKIFHFRNADDYKNAVDLYPGFEQGTYYKDMYTFQDGSRPIRAPVYKHLKKQLTKYFLDPMKKLERIMLSSGVTQKDIDAIKPKETGPYIYHEIIDKVKRNIISFVSPFDYANIDTSRIKKQYKIDKAYAQLKYHSENLTKIIDDYYAELLAKVGPSCINYDAMRADGYDGFYIHPEAVAESELRSKAIQKENAKHFPTPDNPNKVDIYDVVTWWKIESMCVWNWCFK